VHNLYTIDNPSGNDFSINKKNMKTNMGIVDRVIRLIAAVVIGYLFYVGLISGIVATILGILAVVFILTSMISFCPLYLPFKLSTKKKEN
jgi:nicotinamide riboside transporter PnuC